MPTNTDLRDRLRKFRTKCPHLSLREFTKAIMGLNVPDWAWRCPYEVADCHDHDCPTHG